MPPTNSISTSKGSKGSKSDKSNKSDKSDKSDKSGKISKKSKGSKSDALDKTQTQTKKMEKVEKMKKKEAKRVADEKALAAAEAEKQAAQEEGSDSDAEDGEEEEEDVGSNDGEGPAPVDEDSMAVEGDSLEKIADRKAMAKKLARIRGYRTVATKGGFTPEYDSGCSHLDVATPVLSDAEVIRACKWAPKISDKAAYDVLNEFDERLGLTLESLPPAAAKVIRAHGETYLRKIMVECVQRTSDMQLKTITVQTVVAVVRQLQRAQKYTFMSPKGIVDYAQNDADNRLDTNEADMGDDASNLSGIIVAGQIKSASAIADAEAAKSKKRKEVREARKEQRDAVAA